MFVNAATANALDYIAERASDVYKAYTPGARPSYGDVETERDAAVPVLDPLSVAPPADAYFVTAGERGRRSYTQNGTLAVAGGTVTAAGAPVLGVTAPGGALAELHIDPVDLALGRATNVHVEADGSVAYMRSSVDPRSGARESERVTIGRLALARFPAGTKLQSAGADRAVAPAGVLPHVGSPGDGNFAPVAPLHREQSRVNLDESLNRLEDAYLAFDALAAAHKAQGSLGKTAMDLLK
ncbi:MAG TPA: hypothetical protein VGN11_11855 [Candidatus Baltobacteraceae bacterium]|jgi:flagellar basal body rod protein FlgG|nr:hypothetical protein [Candidatus Baltobacteraceae bacterium]